MKIHIKRWLCALLALMLTVPMALAEEVGAAPVETEVPWIEVDLSGAVLGDGADTGDPLPGDIDGAPLLLGEEGAKPYAYAWTVAAENPVYIDADLMEPVYSLSASEAVLITGEADSAAAVAFDTAQGPISGYMDAACLAIMTAAESADLLDELAQGGAVALYGDDIDWPLPLAVKGGPLAASDFKALSNDEEYVIQGKTITARMVGDHSDCWSWARALYYIIWGTKFTTDFEGTDETGRNLIRNLTDDNDRLLTGENLKSFIGQSELGCTLRICSCPSNCSNFSKDGCSKHEKHSLIVVAKDADGMVVMDNMTGNGKDRFATRYYTWDNFAKHWAKYKMVKYIKWPGAPEYRKSSRTTPSPEPTVQPEQVVLSAASMTLAPDETRAVTASVLPEGADQSLRWSSSDPFVAYLDGEGNVVAVGEGRATLTAQAVNGVKAAIAVTVRQAVAPTGVSLDRSGTVKLAVGATLQLNATLKPANASAALAWKSSNTKVATVSDDGLVTAVKAGSATVTVITANKKTAKVKIKVTAPADSSAVKKVKLNKSGTVKLKLGKTLQLKYAVNPSGANPKVVWKSTNEKVAKISSSGLVTAVKTGTCTVGVITENGKYATVKIKVVK